MATRSKSTASKRRPAKSTERSSRGRIVAVDFSDTESRGGKKGSRSSRVPPGDYFAKVKAAALTKSPDKETPEIKITYVITRGKKKGSTLIDDLYLTKKALWRVRQTWEAAGIKVPSKRVKLDPSRIIGKEVAVTVEDDEYENKVRSRVIDTFLLSELEELRQSEDDLEEDEDESEDEEEEENEDEDEEEDDEDTEDEDEDEDDDLEDVDLDSI
jgi:hypothetical protein